MNLSERDRRIILFLIPLVVLIAYWFLIYSPKRSDLTTARNAQHAAEAARDTAVAQADTLEHARQTFAADYADVVRLGKAIPATIDSPSLLVQLDRASKGTHIDFNSVTFGDRAAGAVTVPTTTTQGPAQPNGNAAAGGAPAATGLGGVAETAGNTVTTANQTSSNAEAAGATSTAGTATTATTATTTAATGSAPAFDHVVRTRHGGTHVQLPGHLFRSG